MLWSDSLLRGKRILITGASSGIGRSCALLCSELGAEVIVCGRNTGRLSETLLALSGKNHLQLAFDLTDEKQIEEKLSTIRETAPISGFIHCAGIERTNPIKTITMDDYTDMFKTNVASAVTIIKQIMKPKMFDKQGFSIVFLSSISGLNGEKGKSEYSSTKSAITGLTKSLALELSGKGCRVNCICPAMVHTEMLERMFADLPERSVQQIEDKHLLGIPQPSDIANLAVFLVSDLSQYITGTNIIIDSGYSLN